MFFEIKLKNCFTKQPIFLLNGKVMWQASDTPLYLKSSMARVCERAKEREKIEEMVSYEWWNLSFEICLLRILLLIHFLHWNEEFREKKRKLRSDDDHKHYCYYYFPLVKWNLLAVWPNVNINSSPISLQSSPNSPPPKVAQKLPWTVFTKKGHFSEEPKKPLNIWATFVRKFEAKVFSK